MPTISRDISQAAVSINMTLGSSCRSGCGETNEYSVSVIPGLNYYDGVWPMVWLFNQSYRALGVMDPVPNPTVSTISPNVLGLIILRYFHWLFLVNVVNNMFFQLVKNHILNTEYRRQIIRRNQCSSSAALNETNHIYLTTTSIISTRYSLDLAYIYRATFLLIFFLFLLTLFLVQTLILQKESMHTSPGAMFSP